MLCVEETAPARKARWSLNCSKLWIKGLGGLSLGVVGVLEEGMGRLKDHSPLLRWRSKDGEVVARMYRFFEGVM